MNRVLINIEGPVPNSNLGAQESFEVCACDNYVENIEIFVLAPSDFLSKPGHEIVALLVKEDGDIADLIEAALMNETDIYVNGGGPNVDREALRDLLKKPSP
jgi:hypothetical protein